MHMAGVGRLRVIDPIRGALGRSQSAARAVSVVSGGARHSPLAGTVDLADAPFWSAAQGQFLREESQRDEPPWSELIDQLNTALRR